MNRHSILKYRQIVISFFAFLISVLLLLLHGSMRADASSGYKVKVTEADTVIYYSVYKNSSQAKEDHFYSSVYDVYNSMGSHRYTIRFFRPFAEADEHQAEALARYLGKRSKANYCQYGWYGQHTNDNPPIYWVYLIEGWNQDKSVDKLIEANPWRNSISEWFVPKVVGHGDLTSSKWSFYRNEMECSAAVWFPQKNLKDGVTVGFSFISGEENDVVRRYCIDEFDYQ